MLPLLLACAGAPDDTGADAAPFDGAFVLTDANNYAYTSALSPGVQEVGLRADFTVDWSDLTTDLLGHAMDPAADVDNVWLIQFPSLTEEELVSLLLGDDLYQEDVGAIVQFRNEADATSARLADFVFPPNAAIDPESDFVDGSGSWILRATTGLMNNRMLTFVRPSEGSDNHALVLDPTSTTLRFDADLGSLVPFAFDAGFPSYTADWSGLTTDAGGDAIDLDRIDQLLLARYDGRSVADLEADFLDIELIADATYTADVYGRTAVDFAELAAPDGAAFAGFTADSLWLLALRCTTCTNPTPPFLTVVQVGG